MENTDNWLLTEDGKVRRRYISSTLIVDMANERATHFGEDVNGKRWETLNRFDEEIAWYEKEFGEYAITSYVEDSDLVRRNGRLHIDSRNGLYNSRCFCPECLIRSRLPLVRNSALEKKNGVYVLRDSGTPVSRYLKTIC